MANSAGLPRRVQQYVVATTAPLVLKHSSEVHEVEVPSGSWLVDYVRGRWRQEIQLSFAVHTQNFFYLFGNALKTTAPFTTVTVCRQ
jgi:hypothetical protein